MNISTKISAALAVAAISAAFMGYSTSANAAGSMLSNCQANSRGAVVKCCESWIKKNGRPFWMSNANSCGTSVSCSGGSGGTNLPTIAVAYVKKPKCFLESTPPENGSHDSPTPPSTRGGNLR